MMKRRLAFVVLILLLCSSVSIVLLKAYEKKRQEQEAISKVAAAVAYQEEQRKIEENNSKKRYEDDYNRALEYVNSNDFLRAIDILEGMTDKDNAVYSKIREVIGLYLSENIKMTDSCIKDKKYKEALERIETISNIYEKEKDIINSEKTLASIAKEAVYKAELLNKVISLDRSYPVTILYYHSISVQPGNDLCVPPEKFREQMKYLKEMQYNVVNFDELDWYYTNEVPVPPKTVIVTLDDGYADNYTNALPIFKEFGLKATIFVIASIIDMYPTHLNSQQIHEIEANGLRIESHTLNHDEYNKLATLPYETQLQQLKESKLKLEELLNRKVNYVCYPYGSYNANTLKAAQDAGYRMGVTTESGRADKSNGLFKLKRVYVGSKYTMDIFKQLVSY